MRRSAALQALRMTASSLAAFGLASAFGLPQGFWAVVTALIVTQGNVGGSLKAAFERFAGSVCGAVYGGAIAFAVPHDGVLARAAALVLAVGPLSILAALLGRFPHCADHGHHRAAGHRRRQPGPADLRARSDLGGGARLCGGPVGVDPGRAGPGLALGLRRRGPRRAIAGRAARDACPCRGGCSIRALGPGGDHPQRPGRAGDPGRRGSARAAQPARARSRSRPGGADAAPAAPRPHHAAPRRRRSLGRPCAGSAGQALVGCGPRRGRANSRRWPRLWRNVRRRSARTPWPRLSPPTRPPWRKYDGRASRGRCRWRRSGGCSGSASPSTSSGGTSTTWPIGHKSMPPEPVRTSRDDDGHDLSSAAPRPLRHNQGHAGRELTVTRDAGDLVDRAGQGRDRGGAAATRKTPSSKSDRRHNRNVSR